MSTPAKENSRGDGGTVKTPSSVRARGEARGTRERGGEGRRDGWMRCDFLNASIVSVVVAMDARACRSFIARAFWFFLCVRRRDRWTDDEDDDDGGSFRFFSRG